MVGDDGMTEMLIIVLIVVNIFLTAWVLYLDSKNMELRGYIETMDKRND